MSKPDISIIIRTLNEERYLGSLLGCILDQKVSFSREIILIDSGSTDSTIEIARSYNCHIHHISREEFSFGRSLNRACEAAQGDFIVLVSGHCIPCNEYWLYNLVRPLADGIIKYSYGRQLGGVDTYWSECRIFSKYFPPKSNVPQRGFYCNNANSALLASVWESYRFKEELTGLEDMDLAKRLVIDGGKVGYIAEAGVYHLHHENWYQVQRRFEREALALREICPEVILRRRDVLRYFSRGLIGDIVAGLPKSLTLRQITHIIRYRYHQYLGSYYGNHLHRQVSREMRDSYYYPAPSKGYPLTSTQLYQ